jgi:N-acetylneuraminate synthase
MIDFSKLSKPYLIAEIGINHNGDMQIAKKLIDATFACSWDCAKFQKRYPEVSVPDHQKNVVRDTPWGKMTYLEYKYRIEFEKQEYDYIDKYCKEKPLDWTASVWDIDSLNFLMQYDLPFLKVPSAHNDNKDLLLESCKSGLPVILSTGMSTIEEVDIAVNLLMKHAKSYAIMHTNSSYPAKDEELNLSMITKFKERYNCPVGYSGHEYGLDSTTIAVALGATIVERHITLDHKMWGTDQSSSVEIQGMDKLFKQINSVGKYLGDGIKHIYESELSIRKKLRGN